MKTQSNQNLSKPLNVRSVQTPKNKRRFTTRSAKQGSALPGRLPLLAGMALLLCALASAVPASAGTVISDSVFNDSNWTHSILWYNPMVTLGPVSQNLALQDAGGNNGFEMGRHTSDGPFAGLYDGHLDVGGGTYNPSTQGAIQSLNVSYDLKTFAGPGIQDGLLLEQSGRTFLYFVDSAGPYANWTHLGVTGITDTWNPAWVEIDTANNQIINFTTPDFSSSGGPIEFGYYTFNWSLPQGGLVDSTWGIDNFSVQINTATPEPSSLMLLGSGILGISGLLRKRFLG